MYGTAKHPGSFDEVFIEDRNERPLTIALATIVVVWSLAFALTIASGHVGAHAAHLGGHATAVMSSMDK